MNWTEARQLLPRYQVNSTLWTGERWVSGVVADCYRRQMLTAMVRPSPATGWGCPPGPVTTRGRAPACLRSASRPPTRSSLRETVTMWSATARSRSGDTRCTTPPPAGGPTAWRPTPTTAPAATTTTTERSVPWTWTDCRNRLDLRYRDLPPPPTFTRRDCSRSPGHVTPGPELLNSEILQEFSFRFRDSHVVHCRVWTHRVRLATAFREVSVAITSTSRTAMDSFIAETLPSKAQHPPLIRNTIPLPHHQTPLWETWSRFWKRRIMKLFTWGRPWSRMNKLYSKSMRRRNGFGSESWEK